MRQTRHRCGRDSAVALLYALTALVGALAVLVHALR
jgi:hypothetical protein